MANTANLISLTTDFNVTPYYDDYNPDDNYYRILFKPGFAVQARELTQSQTILQNQISRFGKHIFKEGSIVLPGKFNIETNTDYVKVRDVDNANNTVIIENFNKQIVTNPTTGLQAKVELVADGIETNNNSKTIFLSYLNSSSTNSAIQTFEAGDVLVSNSGGTLIVASSIPSGGDPIVGKGSRFIIETGVFFAKNHFISFPTQSIILDRYNTEPTCRVGFFVSEEILSYEDDTSLLDPALESSNYAAPGADRLKLNPQLQVLPLDDSDGTADFVELFSIQNGVVTELYERPQYNILRDELAKQKFDESGDYYVSGLGVRIRENLDTGINGGFSNTGNSQLLSIGVEPGVGYVKGYEINKLVTEYITIDKSTSSKTVNSQIATATTGSYVTANQVTGSITHDQGSLVTLYDKADRRLSDKLWASPAPTGNSIGTARVFAVKYDSGTLGTPDGAVNIFMTDIRMNGTNSFANVRSVYSSSPAFGSDIIISPTSGNTAVLQDVPLSTLIYDIGLTAIKTIRDGSDNPKMSFDFYRSGTVNFTTGGTVTFSPTFVTGESFPYGTTTLSDEDRREIVVSFDSDETVSGTGTVTGSGNVITAGTAGAFTNLRPGDKVEFSGNTTTWRVLTRDTVSQITLQESSGPSSLTGNTWSKVYKAGDILDLTTIGLGTGLERTVSATPTALSFSLQETFGTTVAAKITYPVSRVNAAEITKELRKDRYVIINCSTTGTRGPFNLGFPDIYKINKIVRKSGSNPTSLTDGTDVTSSFVLDNGQRDMFYDHGKITPKISLSASDRLLVSLDYFYPSFSPGFGFFSVDSYPVDDDESPAADTIRTEQIPFFNSPVTKARYDLRNCLDFRPFKAVNISDTNAQTIGVNTPVNPAPSTNFYYDTNGLRIPVPSTRIQYDFQYYESRRDIIAIDRSGIITQVKGVPGAFPITPEILSNAMGLASIFVAPYPSLAPNYAQQIKRKDLGCVSKKISNVRFTMRDIGVLKDRIVNLEYYTSLNALEKAAVDLRIRDKNGLDRFKNGIFVDPFNDHIFGDTNDPNYRIIVDRQEKSIRPVYTMNSLGYDYISGTNIKKTGDLITLNYTEETLIEQPRATTNRNIELTSYRFIGNLYLNPDIDVWRDVERRPDEVIYTGPDPNSVEQGVVTTWGEWKTTTGQTKTYSGAGAASYLKGYGDTPVTVVGITNKGVRTGAVRQTTANNAGVSPTRRDSLVISSQVSNRTGVETTTVLGELETVSVNDRLIDTRLVPYIRPQSINVFGRGFKPNTTVNFFFDGENMNKYVTPYSNTGIVNTQILYVTQEENEIVDIQDFNTGFWYYSSNTEGSRINTSSQGELYFQLRLPQEKPFRVGTKELIVTDSITNSVDASTYGKSYFVAHGLVTTKQNTILTTRQFTQTSRTVNETSEKTLITYFDAPSCAAYSFVPKAPAGEEGVFLTSVDLFFSAKHPTLGVWFEIREMDSAGGITRNQVPFSEVWLRSNQVNISSDASAATNIKFPAPVFLYSDTQYAFVIHTEGLNPDYYFWVSRLGETDVRTRQQVTSRGLTGTFYTTNNNRNWDIVPDLDLKIKFNRAKFVVGSGEITLGNKPIEKLVLSNVSSTFDTYGERFIGNDRLTLSDPSSNSATIVIGDRLIGVTSGANGVVRTISGSVFGTSNNFFVPGERVNIANANGTLYSKQSTITTKRTAVASLYTYKFFDEKQQAEFVSSNGNFYVGDTIRGSSSKKTAVVESVANLRYSIVSFEPSYIRFNKTPVSFQMRTYSNTAIQGNYFDITEGEDYYFEDERAIFSRTFEKDRLGSTQSNRVKINMSTATNYLSPVLDIGRTHTVYVNNIINANTRYESGVDKITLTGFANGSISNVGISNVLVGRTSTANSVIEYIDGNFLIMSNSGFRVGETVDLYNANLVSINAISASVESLTKVESPSTPLLYNKYISIPITLAEGQDAEDINVILTAYRPPQSDVKVWIKIIHNEDSDTIGNAPWIELEKSEEDVFSSLANRNDFKEIAYRFPQEILSGPNGEVQYTNSLGITFTGFKYYAVKIGLLGGPENTTEPINSAFVPRVADLRIVCLQI
jgi:hypothetical protein